MTERITESAVAREGEERDRGFDVHSTVLHALEDGGPPAHFNVKVRVDHGKLVYTMKEGLILSWIEARNAVTEGNQGENEIAFLCAVDGLRKDPRTGEAETTMDWRHHVDNLTVELLPDEHDFRNDNNNQRRDCLAFHVHGVRRMYRLLRRPEEVRHALARYYGSHPDDDRWNVPTCADKFVTRVMPALERYYEVMNFDGLGLQRMAEVADRLGLAMDANQGCNDERNCIACSGESPTWGGQVWPKDDYDDDDDDSIEC